MFDNVFCACNKHKTLNSAELLNYRHYSTASYDFIYWTKMEEVFGYLDFTVYRKYAVKFYLVSTQTYFWALHETFNSKFLYISCCKKQFTLIAAFNVKKKN